MVEKSLSDTWTLFKDNVAPISLIVLSITIPAAIFEEVIQNNFATDSSDTLDILVQFLISTAVYPIYSVATIFFIAAVVSGEKMATGTLLKLGIRFWFPYTILSALFGVAVMFGFVLLIIPGVILMIRWSFAPFELLLNQSKPYDALRESWKATKSFAGVLLKGYLFLIVILFGSNILLGVVMESWLGNSSISFQVMNAILSLGYEVLYVMFTIFTFYIYGLSKAQQK